MKKIKVISEYTTEQAISDGVLVPLIVFNEKWKDKVFNIITRNLLHHFEKDNEVDTERLCDFLISCHRQMLMKTDLLTKPDDFFEFVYISQFNRLRVFAVRNEYDRFTLMLPEDY